MTPERKENVGLVLLCYLLVFACIYGADRLWIHSSVYDGTVAYHVH